MFYQFSSKYLKFELGDTKIFKNFKLIPACTKWPKIYNEISKSVKRIRSVDSCFLNKIDPLSRIHQCSLNEVKWRNFKTSKNSIFKKMS